MSDYLLSIIQGRRHGFGAAVVRGALCGGSLLYALLHGLHRAMYAIGLRRGARFPVPVASIGNLTAGGTGKTPLVEAIARRLSRRNLKVAVLARGYGRRPQGGDDEDLLNLAGLKNVIRIADPDRVSSGRRAVSDFHADVLLLDDGFQHYRIRRDLEILTVDATQPFSNGWLLPRGLLRDRPSALRRATAIILTRVDQTTPAELAFLKERIAVLSGGRPVIESVHRPTGVRTLWNKGQAGLEWLKDRRVYAFCGLGNPDSFRRTLQTAGADVVKFRSFPDHHPYGPRDARLIEAEAQEFMAQALVTTEKDATKLNPAAFGLPLAALRVELEIVRGDDILESLLDALVQERTPAATASLK